MKNIIAALRTWARDYEPAQASAFVYAVLAVAGTLGYGQLVADLEPVTNGVLGLIAALALFLSGRSTRKRVFSPHTLEGDPDAAAEASESFDDEPVETTLLSDEQADEADGIAPGSDDGIRV